MVSTHNGKNVAGWRLPPLIPLEIGRGVEDHVQSSIEEIRSKAIRERRSDSEPYVFDTAFGQETAAVAMSQFNPLGFHGSLHPLSLPAESPPFASSSQRSRHTPNKPIDRELSPSSQGTSPYDRIIHLKVVPIVFEENCIPGPRGGDHQYSDDLLQ